MNWTQQDAPLMDALKEHLMNRVVRFDVPGHKGGRGNHELADFLGQRCVQIDVNSMKNLDNLCHPVSVLRDAQQLAAEAFGAANAFFIINGATGASQAMIMSVCKAGEKLIMPRNVHRSAINALVVNGAIPVYVDPDENKDLGIPLGMSVEAVERAILANPDAKAVLVNNPTYYGVCPDIRRIAKLAHELPYISFLHSQQIFLSPITHIFLSSNSLYLKPLPSSTYTSFIIIYLSNHHQDIYLHPLPLPITTIIIK